MELVPPQKKTFDITSLFSLIFVIFISWILIHFLAGFGIFFSVVYIFVWLIYPGVVPCLFCRFFKGAKTRKRFCGHSKKEAHSPGSFSAALFGSMLVLIMSFVSLLIVWGEAQLFIQLNISEVGGRTAYFVMPTDGSYAVGKEFDMNITIAGIKEPVNVIRTDIKFNPDILEVIDVNTNDSIANVFVQKHIDNELGFVRLVGGIPNPGFEGDGGVFGVMRIVGEGVGVGEIEYLSTSVLLANDGKGTNVLDSTGKVSFAIVPGDEGFTDGVTELVLEKDVLGVEEGKNENQFIFYPEEDSSSNDDFVVDFDNNKSVWNRLGDYIVNLDTFIIDWWR